MIVPSPPAAETRPSHRRPGRSSRDGRPALERLEGRSLMSVFTPAQANYAGGRQVELAVFRRGDNSSVQPEAGAAASILLQAPSPIGYELGLNGFDTPTPADFEGIGRAQPAVYGFLNNTSYGPTYGTISDPTNSHPFPQGSGRFAYIPIDGVYPPHRAGAVNGSMNAVLSKVVIVNIGKAGDIPAPADYDGDRKADFAVYEPSSGQFLVYPSSTFDPNADPTLPGHQPMAVPLGGPGDLPASADFQGLGRANFAVYDPARHQFLVRPADGGPTVVVPIGGPGDVPAPADYEGSGRADFAVYDPAQGRFLVKPASGAPAIAVPVGLPGDVPASADYDGDGKVDFGTFTASNLQWHFRRASDGTYRDRTFTNPDAVPTQRTDDIALAEHRANLARDRPDVVILGDSITDFWARNYRQSWAAFASRYRAADDGVGGDAIQDILLRVETGELASHPKVVILMSGTIDMGYHGRSVSETADSLRVLVDAIHAASPTSSLLLMSVFPRGEDTSVVNPTTRQTRQRLAAKIRAFNEAAIPFLAPPFDARFAPFGRRGDYSIDLTTRLNRNPADPTDTFANPADFISDLLHPNAAGYQVWASALATPLRTLLALPIAPVDYEGTGQSDLAVYLPGVGSIAIRPSDGKPDKVVPFGTPGAGQSIPATGDYDGDGKADLAVYLPSLGEFAYRPSGGGPDAIVPFGAAGVGRSLPVPGDYDGDGKTDLTIYLPSDGSFTYRPSGGGPDVTVPFGVAGVGRSLPAPGDYDGDGKTDLAVYLTSIGAYSYRPSGGGPDQVIPFGASGPSQSIPVPGDYDGSGRTELAVYLPALGQFAYRPAGGGPDRFIPFGIPGADQSIPAPGDYDGDGLTDLAVYLPSLGAFAYRPSRGGPDVVAPFGFAGPGGSLPMNEVESPTVLATTFPLPKAPTPATPANPTPKQEPAKTPARHVVKVSARKKSK